jgi:hypothetical protein
MADEVGYQRTDKQNILSLAMKKTSAPAAGGK